MNIKIKYAIGILSLVCVLSAAVLVGHVQEVKAKSALNLVTSNTTRPLSTTTPAYITAGAATTTFQYYTNGISRIGFNVLYQASSTVNTNFLNWRYEYSWDAVSWYSDDIELTTNATTTTHVRTFAEHQWQFATSTGGSSNSLANGSVDYKHFNLSNIASPFTRVVFYVPAGSGPAAIYVQAVLDESNTI